jgi:hypothetical protein
MSRIQQSGRASRWWLWALAVLCVVSGGTSPAAAQAVQLSFNSPPSTYTAGSNTPLDFTVRNLPNGHYIVVNAWNVTNRSGVAGFGFTLRNGPWVIPGERMDLLPVGTMNVQLHHKDRSGRTVRQVQHRMTVVRGTGGSGTVTPPPPPPPTQPSGGAPTFQAIDVPHTRTRGSSEPIQINVSGSLAGYTGLLIQAWDVDNRRLVREFSHVLDRAPFTITAERLNMLPPSQYQLQVLLRRQGVTISRMDYRLRVVEPSAPAPSEPKPPVQPAPEPQLPSMPTVRFASNTPTSYQQGSGQSLTFQVEGGSLPQRTEVLVLAQTQAQVQNSSGVHNAFTMQVTGNGPFVIPANRMNMLPSGLIRLQLLSRVDSQPVNQVYHWIDVASPASNGGNSGGSGSKPGSGGDGSGGDEVSNPGSGGGTVPPVDVLPDRSRFLGTNLGALRRYSREWVFTNVYLQSEDRGVRDDGYRQFTVMLDVPRYPQGMYTAMWEGSGEVTFSASARVVQHVNSNKLIVEVNREKYRGNQIMILTRGDVRNLQVWMPGFAPGEPNHGHKFHPLFIERLRPFNVIRFMDWQDVNNAFNRRWATRILPGDPQGGLDVAVEHMIDLANTLKADPWFCISHLADEDYTRNFARMVRDNLHPDATIYIEWSNEVWNTTFSQSRWSRDQAAARGVTYHQVWAEQARRHFAIWHEVFGDQKHRIVRVLAAQENNPWVAEQLIRHWNGEFDAISCTAYFGNRIESTNLDVIMQQAIADIWGQRGHNRARHGQLAREQSQALGRPIRFLAYEAGHHITTYGRFNQFTEPFKQVQYHPAMYGALQDNMFQFEQAGGSLYVAYYFVGPNSHFGAWGHLEHMDQPLDEAQKFRAVSDYPQSKRRLQLYSHN